MCKAKWTRRVSVVAGAYLCLFATGIFLSAPAALGGTLTLETVLSHGLQLLQPDGTLHLDAKIDGHGAGDEIEFVAWVQCEYGEPQADVRVFFWFDAENEDETAFSRTTGSDGRVSVTHTYKKPGEYNVVIFAWWYFPASRSVSIVESGISEIKWGRSGRTRRYGGEAFLPFGADPVFCVEPASPYAPPEPSTIMWTLRNEKNGSDICLGSGYEISLDKSIYSEPGRYKINAAVVGVDGERYSEKRNYVNLMAIYYRRESLDEDWRKGEDAVVITEAKGYPGLFSGTEIAVRHTMRGLEEYPELKLSRNLVEGVDYRRLENRQGEPPWAGPDGIARFKFMNNVHESFSVSWIHPDCWFTGVNSDHFYLADINIEAFPRQHAQTSDMPEGHGEISRDNASTTGYYEGPEDAERAVALLLSPHVKKDGGLLPVSFKVKADLHRLIDAEDIEWSLVTNPNGNATFVEREDDYAVVEIDTSGEDGGAGLYRVELASKNAAATVEVHVVSAKFEDGAGLGEPAYPEYILSAQSLAYPFMVSFNGPEGAAFDLSQAAVRFMSDPSLDRKKSFDLVAGNGAAENIGTCFDNLGVKSGSDSYLYTLSSEAFRVSNDDITMGWELPAWQNEARILPWITARMVLPDGHRTTSERLSGRPVPVKWTHPDLPVVEIGGDPGHLMTFKAPQGYFMRPDETDTRNAVLKKSDVAGFTYPRDRARVRADFFESDERVVIEAALHSKNWRQRGEEWLATQTASYYIATAFSYPKRKGIDDGWAKNGVCDLRTTTGLLYPDITPGYAWWYSWRDIAASDETMAAVWTIRLRTGLAAAGLGAATVATAGKVWIAAPVIKALRVGSISAGGLNFLAGQLMARQAEINFSGQGSGATLKLKQNAYFAPWGADESERAHVNTKAYTVSIAEGVGRADSSGDGPSGNGLFYSLKGNNRSIAVGDSMVAGWQGTVMLRNVSLGILQSNEAETMLRGSSLRQQVKFNWKTEE